MRKRVLALILIASMAVTGCMSTTLEEKQEKDAKENNGVTGGAKYTAIEDMDFALGHIEGLLKDNFRVDADVTVNVPKECGTYEFARKKVDMTEEQYTECFDEMIDNYFENDVTCSDIDQRTSDIELIINSWYNGNMGEYYKKDFVKDRSYYNGCQEKMQLIEQHFYEYGFEYDTELIDGVVDKFLEKCSKIVPDGMKGDYECVHIDDEYWAYLNEKYGVEEMKEFWKKEDMEYYAINMYSEVEEGMYFKAFEPKFYDAVKGEVTDEVCIIQEMEAEGYADIMSHMPQSVRMIVTEEGELVFVQINDYYTIEEKVCTNTILSAQEALEKFCKNLDGVLLKNELLVKSMTLEYVVDVEKQPDETGYRNATLIPVWVIRYHHSTPDWIDMLDKKMILSAIDGSVY